MPHANEHPSTGLPSPPLTEPGLVSFVGAGPGDPELLTLKGRKAIEEAGLVLYAGSLVPPAVVSCARAEAQVVDSAPLTLEECHRLVRGASLAGQKVARVHTGDPSLYGALREQAALLDADGIPWRVIPGVTAACAAAAAAGITFTVPEVTQSLIITRMEGRTPMPESERLSQLAAHGTSLAVYLSAHVAEDLQAELRRSLPPETPVVCACRVGWPEERIIRTTLEELARAVDTAGITRQAIFLILPGEAQKGAPSRLYAADFSHGWRRGTE
ncbi:MAG: precorrin-4 C(11)-methyltransferase [Desulfovibrionaceae bacterium]|nr:precorrin-4 C(11)-methyltransferase [Desulfovibrionaceae bacterium]